MNAPPRRGIAWSGVTHPGKVRTNNEDAFLALTLDGHEVRYLGKTGSSDFAQGDFVFAVSDGMGGAKSGEFASRVTVEKITRLLPRSFRLTATGLDGARAETLHDLCLAIHDELTRLGRFYEECAGMGATLTLAWFNPETVFFAHVGDSRLYHLPGDGDLRQLSHDHNYVGWLRRNGQINERQQRAHPQRNALSQALGANVQFVEPQIGMLEHRRGDRFLLVSDGVVDALWDRQVEELARHGDRARPAAEVVLEAALATEARDNITAVVVDLPG